MHGRAHVLGGNEEILLAGSDRQGARYREVLKAQGDAVEAMRKLVMLAVLGVAEGPNEATILRNDAQQIKANPRLRLIEKHRQDTKRLWISVVRKGVDGYGDEFVGFRDGWRGVLEDATMELTIDSTRDGSRYLITVPAKRVAKISPVD